MTESTASHIERMTAGLAGLARKPLGDVLEQMRGMNAAVTQIVLHSEDERPIAGVILLRHEDPGDNQAVIDAVDRVTDDEDDWIAVTERLPEPHEDVLVFGGLGASDDDPQVEMGYRAADGTWWLTGTDEIQLVGVTDWQPLPRKPKRNREHAA